MNVIFPFSSYRSKYSDKTRVTSHGSNRWLQATLAGSRPVTLALLVVIATITLVGCTGRQLGGSVEGWSPVGLSAVINPDEPLVIYVVVKLSGDLKDLATSLGFDEDALKDDENKVKVKAIINDSSGTLRVKWSFPPLGSGTGIEGSLKPPAISDPLGLIFISTISGELFAIDTETGTVGDKGWNRQVSADGAGLISGPALGRTENDSGLPIDVVVVGSENSNLYGFDAVNGDPLSWSPFTGANDKIWSTPVINEGVIYFGSHDGSVYAVSLQSGEQLWKFNIGSAVVAKPLIVDDMLIVGSFDKKLYAIDIRKNAGGSDRKLWEFEGRNWFWAPAITDGTSIFAPSMDGNVYALDKTGQLQWSYNMGTQIVATPGLVPEGLAVADKDGKIALLDTVQLLRDPTGQNSPFSTNSIKDAEVKVQLVPIEYDNSVIVSAQDGRIWRFRISAGLTQVWCYDASDDSKCE